MAHPVQVCCWWNPVVAAMAIHPIKTPLTPEASLARRGRDKIRQTLHINFRDVHGVPFHQASPANMVLWRSGGGWALVIAAPWGWGGYDRG
jgi:hypothetical protein